MPLCIILIPKSLGWYNWYAVRNIGYINIAYVFLFLIIIWLMIHGTTCTK
jgi:hypothetical protein